MTDISFEIEGRFLSLRGPFIDTIGSRLDQSVAEHYIHNRLARDGAENGHHITVINHLEIAEKAPKTLLDENGNQQLPVSNKQKNRLFKQGQQILLSKILDQFGDVSEWEKPVDLGLGYTESANAKAYYKVIYWPHGQMIRHYLGLGMSNFHVTVGFAPRDVHQYKGPGTLMCLQQCQPCSWELYNRLIDYVPFYVEDRQFIKALYQTGWRHGYYVHVARLTRVLLQSILRLLYYKLIGKKAISLPVTAPPL
ncbi:putative tRNA threonylcarbamoyladenosine biosynthesis protein kae1 [Mucor circinelloides]